MYNNFNDSTSSPPNKGRKVKRTVAFLTAFVLLASFSMILLDSESVSLSGAGGDFTANDENGNEIRYNILTEPNPPALGTVEVVYNNDKEYSGDIVIPNTVTNNGNTYAVTTISDSAFYECPSLVSITIPSSVTTISDSAFYVCTGLESITVNPGNQNYSSVDGVLFDNGKTKLIQYPAGKQDDSYVVPSSVTSIGEAAFANCTGLDTIDLGSVTSIGMDAFNGCFGLTSVTIPDSTTSIGTATFADCTGLTSVMIRSSATIIDDDAFWGCTDLIVIVPTSFTSPSGNWMSPVAFLLKTDSTAIISASLNNDGKIEMNIDPGKGKIVDTVTVTDDNDENVIVTRSGDKWIFTPTSGMNAFELDIVTAAAPDDGDNGDDGFWTTTNIVIVVGVVAVAILGLLYVFVIRRP